MDAVRDDPGAAILDEIAGLEAERARIEAKIAQRSLEFADVRRRQSERQPDPLVGRLEASFAADELSLVLLQPTVTVQRRLAEARRVRGLLPQVWLAWCDGVIEQARVRLIAGAADRLESNLSIVELDYRIVDFAASHTVARVTAWLRRFVARAEPDHRKGQQISAFSRRGVYVQHEDDGRSWVHALIATADASRIDSLLTAMSKSRPVEDVSLEQRRADLFASLLLGRVDRVGEPTGRTHAGAILGVAVPITTLVGLDDTPGEAIDGSFSLPSDMVRELAAEPGTLFYRLLTDPLGRLLDVTEVGRFPSRKLRTAVDIRDGTCAFPTCNVPAANGDADHVIPSPRGPTSADNLRHLCRRHHRIKTFGIVETSFDEAGHRWRLRDGTVFQSETRPMVTARGRPSRLEMEFATFVVDARMAS